MRREKKPDEKFKCGLTEAHIYNEVKSPWRRTPEMVTKVEVFRFSSYGRPDKFHRYSYRAYGVRADQIAMMLRLAWRTDKGLQSEVNNLDLLQQVIEIAQKDQEERVNSKDLLEQYLGPRDAQGT